MSDIMDGNAMRYLLACTKWTGCDWCAGRLPLEEWCNGCLAREREVPAALKTAERRGFIKGLEAARRVARKENGFYLPLDVAAAVARVGAAITARIKREKAKR